MFDQTSLITGLVVGFIFAGLIGWQLRKIEKARGGMGAPDRSMTVKTENTPRSVLQSAAAATRSCIRAIIVLLIIVLAGGFGSSPSCSQYNWGVLARSVCYANKMSLRLRSHLQSEPPQESRLKHAVFQLVPNST